MPLTVRRIAPLKVSNRLQTFVVVVVLVIISGLPSFAQSGVAEPLAVAAASDLQFALPEISAAYTKQTGNTVKITYGSSGNFSTQIANGAPFDVFLSADVSYPRQLIANGQAEASSFTAYSRGSIVLWFGSATDPASVTFANLASPSIQHVAIANPKHAPYGRAAEAALRSAGVYDKIAPKLVLGENISQTAQFVDSGNADAGIVALSLLQGAPSKHKGSWKPVPIDLYPPLNQAAVITTRGTKNPAARSFIDFLKSAEAQSILQSFGFTKPSVESHP